MKLVVFDMDGTLNKTDLYAVEAYHRALADMGITHFTDEDIISRFGAPADEDIIYFFDNPPKEVYDKFSKILNGYWYMLMRSKARPYEGVLQMLSELKESGCKLAVCSNAPLNDIKELVTLLGIEPYIDYMQPLIPGFSKKESLKALLNKVKPSKAVMVGDRFYDEEAARFNNIPFIGCLYGFAPEEMKDADAAAEVPVELSDIIKMFL